MRTTVREPVIIGDATLYCGDCLDILPTLPPQSVDAILTDLPYGTTACKWDTVIPFAPMWAAVKRVLKPRGVFVTTASQPFTSALVMSNVAWFKYCLVWQKGRATGYVHAKNKPLKAHEDIAVFSPGTTVHEGQSDKRMTYNPQFTPGKPYVRRATTVNTGALNHAPTKSNTDGIGRVNVNDGRRYPISVLRFSMHNVGLDSPTQKPVALYAYLVRTYTNEGDTVLDMCMGSGTTGVACVQEGRDFIGIEKDEGYMAIACKRIEQAQMQGRLL